MQIIDRLDEISGSYDVLYVDLWGTVHNGVAPFPAAIAALQAYRQSGGLVVLLTNAPRSRAEVQVHLESMGVPGDMWDTIATSGDAARAAMFTGAVGQKVWFVGEEQDEPFFAPMKILENPTPIERVELKDAEGIVCTGPFDPLADPALLRPQLMMAKQMGLKLLCANPDIEVDVGDVREWCAGALAEIYTEMGGESLYFGKPFPPIYDLAQRRLAELGRSVDKSRILAIGDGIVTDIPGAMGEDIDSLLITGGLFAEETGTPPAGRPDLIKTEAFVTKEQAFPTFVIGRLE